MLPDRYYIIAIGYWLIVTIIFYHVAVQGVTNTKGHSKENHFTMVDRYTRLRPPPQAPERERPLQQTGVPV